LAVCVLATYGTERSQAVTRIHTRPWALQKILWDCIVLLPGFIHKIVIFPRSTPVCIAGTVCLSQY